MLPDLRCCLKCAGKVLLASGALLLTGCSGDKEDAATFSKPPKRETTTSTVAVSAENQTAYIMDRYHAPEERLRRRQARIGAVLGRDAPRAAANQ